MSFYASRCHCPVLQVTLAATSTAPPSVPSCCGRSGVGFTVNVSFRLLGPPTLQHIGPPHAICLETPLSRLSRPTPASAFPPSPEARLLPCGGAVYREPSFVGARPYVCSEKARAPRDPSRQVCSHRVAVFVCSALGLLGPGPVGALWNEHIPAYGRASSYPR